MNSSSGFKCTTARRLPGASLLLVVFAVAVSLLPGVAEWLQYDRQAVAQGAVWRLVTSHFVHWSGEHLLWDVLALGVLGQICEQDGTKWLLVCVTVSAMVISLSLWIAEPQMLTYRGLSGIDSALFAMLAVRIGQAAVINKNWMRLGLAGVVSAGFVAKMVFELLTGDTLFVDSSTAGMVPVPLAHVVGSLVGVVCGLSKDGIGHPLKVDCFHGQMQYADNVFLLSNSIPSKKQRHGEEGKRK